MSKIAFYICMCTKRYIKIVLTRRIIIRLASNGCAAVTVNRVGHCLVPRAHACLYVAAAVCYVYNVYT